MLNASMSIAGTAPFQDDTGGQGNFVYTAPGRYIAIGQGFFASATGTGTVEFNNSQRVYQREVADGGSDSYFFRNKSNTYNDHRNALQENLPVLKIGFDFTNDNGDKLHRQLGVSFKAGNSFGFDVGYDSQAYASSSTDAYFKFPEARQRFVIIGIQEISDDLEFPITVQISSVTPITFGIDEIYNIDRTVFLEDKVSGIVYDLSANSVEFNIPVGTYSDRFYIKFGASALSADEEIINNILAFINNNTKDLVVKNGTSTFIKEVQVYNTIGQMIKSWKIDSDKNEIRLPVSQISAGIYFVHLKTDKGKISKKIVIE